MESASLVGTTSVNPTLIRSTTESASFYYRSVELARSLWPQTETSEKYCAHELEGPFSGAGALPAFGGPFSFLSDSERQDGTRRYELD